MSVSTHVQRVQRSLEALGRGDADGFMDFWSDDVVWRVPGNNPFSGVYRGRQEVRGAVQRFLETADFRFEAVDVLADEGHVVIMFHATGEHGDKSMDMSVANFITVEDAGQWKSCWWLPSDQQAYDEFLR